MNSWENPGFTSGGDATVDGELPFPIPFSFSLRGTTGGFLKDPVSGITVSLVVSLDLFPICSFSVPVLFLFNGNSLLLINLI
jgi:hypothetical protein